MVKFDKSKVDAAVAKARIKHEILCRELIDRLIAQGIPSDIAETTTDAMWETFEQQFRDEFEANMRN